MIIAIRKHPEVVIIATLFAFLASTYSLITPLFEAPDEMFHYPVVQYIATTGRLPVQDPEVETLWEQEGSQPPLYYLISAALTFWIDTSDLEAIRWLNPHAKMGIPLDPDNKNVVIHTSKEDFPWRGTVLAMHLIRFFSVGLGTASVVLTYILARTIWPSHRWVVLLATSLVAFNPMFIFISGTVNNDNLGNLTAIWILLLVIRITLEGITTRRALTLAIVASLATISKISSLTFMPLIGLALLIHALRTGEWRKVILTGLVLLGTWLLVASWWYMRNLILYDELLGTHMLVEILGGRYIKITVWDLRKEWYGFWVSYWALFGLVNILADSVVYLFYSVVSWIALAGIIWWIVQNVRTKAWGELLIPGLLVFQIAITFGSFIRWTLLAYSTQGRLIFPTISAISALMALGLLNWIPEHGQVGGVIAVGGPLLLIAVISPFLYIAPTYTPPPIVEQIPEDATHVGAHFDGLELVAIDVGAVTAVEGEYIPITVYWRANSHLDKPYSVYLHALGRQAEVIGKVDTYPGGGSLPTTLMQTGVIFKDSYSLELDPEFDAPTALRVHVGVWDMESNTVLDPTTNDNKRMDNIIVRAGVAYPRDLSECSGIVHFDSEVNATLFDFARLRADALSGLYRAGDSLTVTLYWEHANNTSTDLTVFVHLVNTEGTIVAQADGPPLNGDYPTTLWRVPCQVKDVHTLQLPEDLHQGEYRIFVGMYDANNPACIRVPALNEDGSPYPDYAVPVGMITVEAP